MNNAATTTRTPSQALHDAVLTAIGALRAVTASSYESDPKDPGLLCVMNVVADSLQLAANYFELEADYEAEAERPEAAAG